MKKRKALEDAMQQFSVLVQKLKTPEDLDEFKHFVFEVLGENDIEEEDDHHDCSGHDHHHGHDHKKSKHEEDEHDEGEEYLTWVIEGTQ